MDYRLQYLLAGLIILAVLVSIYYLVKYFMEPMDLVYVNEKDNYKQNENVFDTVKEGILNEIPDEAMTSVPKPLRDVESEYPLVFNTSKVDIGSYENMDNSYPEDNNKVESLESFEN
jgi:hypothetical protein